MLRSLLRAAAIAIPALPATVGITAVDLDRGTTIIEVNSYQHFPMASVYKLPIALAVLHEVDAGHLSLQQPVTITPEEFAPGLSAIRDDAHGAAVTLTLGRILDATVSDSDNTGADVLQRLLGGSRGVNEFLHGIGVTGIRIDRNEKQIGSDLTMSGVGSYNTDIRDTATPAGMALLLTKIYRHQDGLSAASHELLVSTLTTSRNPRRMVLGLPLGAVLAHKSGQMPRVLNDVGLITTPDGRHHLAVAIFTKEATTDDPAPLIAALGEIARRIYASVAETSPP
jgi:beta-lactamase class A